MGGVDLLDNAVATYRINIKGKKWWWPHFANCLGKLWQEHEKVLDCKFLQKGSIITLSQELVMSLSYNHMTLKNLVISSYQIWGSNVINF